MSGRLDPEVRASLVESGKWEAFKSLRQDLKDEGFAPVDARREALRQLYDDYEEDDDRPNDRGTITPPIPEHMTEDGQLAKAPAGLEGKVAFEQDVVRWVARNVDHPNPDPEDCPDPFAWTLLRQCRASSAFLSYFTQHLWAKLIPSRSQLDMTGASSVDGKVQMDLIERLLDMKAEAERPEEEE